MKNWIWVAAIVSLLQAPTFAGSEQLDFPDKAPPPVKYKTVDANVPMPKWVNPLAPAKPISLEASPEEKIAALEKRVTELELKIQAIQRDAINEKIRR